MPTPKLCPPSPPCHNNLQFTAQCTAPCFIFTCHFTTKHHKAHRFLLLLLLLHPTHCTPDAAEKCCGNTLTVLRYTTLLLCCVSDKFMSHLSALSENQAHYTWL